MWKYDIFLGQPWIIWTITYFQFCGRSQVISNYSCGNKWYTSSSTSREILNKLLNSKSIANDINPDCDVWLSTPTMRTDRGKEALTVSHLTNHLLQLEINIIDNRNITGKQLSCRGLHLIASGCNQLAKNLLAKIKKVLRWERMFRYYW